METSTVMGKFSSADLDQYATDLNQDGICIIRGLFDPDLIARWGAAFNALFQERQNRPGGLAPREQNRYYLTLPMTPPFADASVFANPVILGILDRIFSQEYVMVQLGADVPVKGADYQEIHRDYRPLFTDDIVTPLYALAVNFPLVDVGDDNGPFEMARGTHMMMRDKGLAEIEAGRLPLERFYTNRGDVTIRTPLALHRGTPNLTDTPRPMVVMGYVMHWLHTPNVDLRLPRDFYTALPEKTQKMLRCEIVDELAENRPETYVNFKH